MDTKQVKSLLDQHFSDRVYSVEDGVVWVSGMNANCPHVASKMARTLTYTHDIPTGLVYDDDADMFGGVQFNYGANA